ncbi:cell division protein ZapA [Microvirga pudoricolor]|uniref:cell division protein ZapA n=1 Tax=Microvirga pudoricolor TaxID=2778729 RepID=UPI0019523F4D|nr:cell division protein ZapA [Microvirga pudoricolor]MBM6594990.1 cell division protein ZapA [Microvirga pudoricolor]
MAQVAVNIAGRTYRIACGDGEESHLEGLAAFYDGKIEEMRRSFGEIGDMRLHVMAAITIADEMAETKRRIAALETELAGLRRAASAGDERIEAAEARFADGLTLAAERIEKIARGLSTAAQG